MNQKLDFSTVEPATGNSRLTPGVYYTKITNVELEDGQNGKNSALKLTFTAQNGEYEGATLETKFFLTPKALGRIQYLHERLLGAKFTQKDVSFKQFANYLAQKLTNASSFPLLVSGREGNDGRIYGDLPYTDFILDADTEEKAFEVGGVDYMRSIRKQKNASTNRDEAILSTSSGSEEMEKLPWDV